MPESGNIRAVCRDDRIGPQNMLYHFASLGVFDFTGGAFAPTFLYGVNIGSQNYVAQGIYQIVWSVVDRKSGGAIPSFDFACYAYHGRDPVGADYRTVSCHVVNEQTTWVFIHDSTGALADPADATDRLIFFGFGRRTKVPPIDWVGLMRELNYSYFLPAF